MKISYFCSFCSWSKPLTLQMITVVSVATTTGGRLGSAASWWLYDLDPRRQRLAYFPICKMGIRIRILSWIQRPVRLNCSVCRVSDRAWNKGGCSALAPVEAADI